MHFTTMPEERGQLPELLEVPEWIYEQTATPESVDGAIAQLRAIKLEIRSVKDAQPLLDDDSARRTCRHKLRLLHGQAQLVDAWIAENSDRGDALERAEARNLLQQRIISTLQRKLDKQENTIANQRKSLRGVHAALQDEKRKLEIDGFSARQFRQLQGEVKMLKGEVGQLAKAISPMVTSEHRKPLGALLSKLNEVQSCLGVEAI